MNLIGNVLWIVLCGWVIFCQYVAAGLVLCGTIIGIPFGVQCFKLAIVGLIPFGREIEPKHEFGEGLSLVFNVLWIVTGGVTIALTHVLFAALFAVTIIGIPFALQHWKLAKLSLLPFGKEIS
jgi:uncharacterized membrane protein YccF (DUF307 family)